MSIWDLKTVLYSEFISIVFVIWSVCYKRFHCIMSELQVWTSTIVLAVSYSTVMQPFILPILRAISLHVLILKTEHFSKCWIFIGLALLLNYYFYHMLPSIAMSFYYYTSFQEQSCHFFDIEMMLIPTKLLLTALKVFVNSDTKGLSALVF